jgi:hypothetical protein
MTAIPASRVNYFDRQHLRLLELRDEQAYHIGLRRRHNLSHHSWGIVTGLELLQREDGQIALTPGLAIDGYGRELLYLDHFTLTRAEFDRRATSRLDVWLEYGLDRSDDGPGSTECTPEGGKYRAHEIARLVLLPGAALPNPRLPPGVPVEALDPPQLDTPDDPARRWPVYLGRVVMDVTSAQPTFVADTTSRVYVGLVGDLVDHPGNAARLEIGHRPSTDETRTIGEDTVGYSAGPTRDFAVFVPDRTAGASTTLEPRLLIDDTTTQVMGDTTVHGNLLMDGSALVFSVGLKQAPTGNAHPAIYRVADELRIDAGVPTTGSVSIGVTKDGKFTRALKIDFTGPGGEPVITITGDLRIESAIVCDDVRVRTIAADAAAQITAALQAALHS